MKWTDEAVEAAAKVICGWIGYSWDGLDDRDISDRFPDWGFDGIGHRSMNGGKPALRKAATAALEAASAVAEKEHGDLRAEVERLTRELKHEVATWKSLQEGSASIIDGLHKSVAQARRDENEACAQMSERLAPDIPEVADAIRARMGKNDDK